MESKMTNSRNKLSLTKISYSALLVFTAFALHTSASRVLMVPFVLGRNSRFINMVSLAEMISENKHEVTLLTNHRCLPPRELRNVELKTYPAPEDVPLAAEDTNLVLRMIKNTIFASELSKIDMMFCEYLLRNQSIFQALKSLHYDLMIVDYANTCGRILVDYLNIPTIVWSNFGFSMDDDLFYPIMPSFMPSPLGWYNDNMSLWQRVKNFWEYHLYNNLVLNYYAFWTLDQLKERYKLNVSLPVQYTFKRAKPLIICNADFAFDYPRPLLPHVVPIAGLFNRKARPLTGALKEFIENSGPNGVILVSFGSLFQYIEKEESELIARVLARLPYRVVWRFAAPFEIQKGNNTLCMPWVPQNDILGHNKTRLFITHCGISSAFEAIYHSVPIIGVPLIADQWFNCEKLVTRAKMGQQVNIFEINEKQFESTVYNVISNATFRENAVRTRAIMIDKQKAPKETFIYWVEHVLRHKGSEHLHSSAFWKLSWFQYYSIDAVILSIAIAVVVITSFLFVLVLLLRLVTYWFANGKKVKKS